MDENDDVFRPCPFGLGRWTGLDWASVAVKKATTPEQPLTCCYSAHAPPVLQGQQIKKRREAPLGNAHGPKMGGS